MEPKDSKNDTHPETNIAPSNSKSMVGSWKSSFWDGLFSEAMLVLGSVICNLRKRSCKDRGSFGVLFFLWGVEKCIIIYIYIL